jgi:hypothetical protein
MFQVLHYSKLFSSTYRLAAVALECFAGWPSLRYRKDKRTAFREDPAVQGEQWQMG